MLFNSFQQSPKIISFQLQFVFEGSIFNQPALVFLTDFLLLSFLKEEFILFWLCICVYVWLLCLRL